MCITLFKIRNKQTKKFCTGTYTLTFDDIGKIYTSLQAVHRYLSNVEHIVHDGVNEYYDMCEIVEFKLQEVGVITE